MIAEELKVKITADASDLKQEVNQVKKDLSGIGEAGGGTKLKSNLGQSAEAAEALHQELSSIRGMSFAGLVAGVSSLSDQFKTFKNTKAEFKEMRDYAKQFLDKNSEIYTGDKAFLDWQGEAEALKNYNLHMKEANSLMDEGTGIFGQMAQVSGAVVAGLAAIAAQLLAVIGLVRNAFTVSQYIKEINSEAKKIGMSTQGYQEWTYVLEQCGVEADKLADFVKTLTEEQIAARNGSEDTIAAFQALGMSMEEVSSMSQEDLFATTVERLQNVADEGYRTHLAYTLLGEDAAQLNNVLYLTNAETAQLAANYNLLGGVASQTLIERSTILQNSLSNMRGAWQGLRNTLAEAVLPAITAVVNWLTKAIAVVNLFLKAVLGVEIFPSKGSGTSGYMGGATAGVNNYTGAVNNATKAAEKLKRTTMGFDELNVVQNPNSASGSSGDSGAGGLGGGGSVGGIGGGDLGLNADDLGLAGLSEWFDKYKNIIQDITTWSLIGIGAIGAVLCFLGGNWVGGIAFLGMAGLGIAVGSVEGGTFDRLGQKIKSWWSSFKGWLEDKVMPIFTKDYWVKLWDNIKKAGSEKLAEIKKGFDKDMKPIKDWFNKSIKPIFTKKYWLELWNEIKLAASTKLGEIKKSIDSGIKPAKDWYEKKLKPIFTKKYWNTLWDEIKTAAGTKVAEVRKSIDTNIAPLKNWYNNKLKPIFTKTYWTTKWNSVKDGAKAAFNGVISTVETAVNNIIKKINTLSWKIPDWVPKLGGKTFGFNFKQVYIPRLATGGIATRSTLANIGEAGREAVLPLENNTGWMDTLADKIAARNQGPTKIVLKVGEKELGWATINSINNITQQTGGLQLKI